MKILIWGVAATLALGSRDRRLPRGKPQPPQVSDNPRVSGQSQGIGAPKLGKCRASTLEYGEQL